MKVALIKGGGGDTYYELGLLSGLIAQGIFVDFIGSDHLKNTDILKNEYVKFYNLRGDQDPRAPLKKKIFRILYYYLRLMKYAAKTDAKLFHIQWMEKFIYFDRTLLNIYYKILGKKLIFTAHNVNAGVRDGNDNIINRLTLRFMYKMVHHIIVHTDKMKNQLINDFNIKKEKVSVISYGINNMVPISPLTKIEARKKLHLEDNEKVILFFGNITPYKGLAYLLLAGAKLIKKHASFKLIIAGSINNKDALIYWKLLEKIIEENNLEEHIIYEKKYIPNEEIEVYFKSADVLILPYTYIFQSGVLFMSYAFGLPVIATEVGALKDYIIEEKTGFLCKPADAVDLARKINYFFNSNLFNNLEANRNKIIEYANKEFSWEKIGEKTKNIYNSLLKN